MQYGVLSDIHGSRTALEAVWRALERAGVTGRVVFNAGDNVGYGDDPEGCVQFLRSGPDFANVQGNYDKNVAQFPERESAFRRKWGLLRPEKFAALRQDSGRISPETRRWLLELPLHHSSVQDGFRILMAHYSPLGKEGLGSWTPDGRLREIAEGIEADVVLCGHTHTPFVRRAGNVLFVNPGTVGRGRRDRASYALLTLDPEAPPTAEVHYLSLS